MKSICTKLKLSPNPGPFGFCLARAQAETTSTKWLDLQRSAVKIQGPGKSPKLTPHTRSFPIKNLCDPCERVIWSNKFSTHATAFLDMSSPLGFCCSLPQFLWSWRQARTQVTNKNIADLIILQDRIDIWCKFWTLCCVVIWDLDPCLH